MMPLLEVSKLRVLFSLDGESYPAVEGLNLSMIAGETLGLVGESGCGKSVTALSLLRLLDGSQSQVSGKISFQGTDLTQLSNQQMRSIRGRRISMIFQEPMSSLNPVFTVGEQLMEVFLEHQHLSRAQARERSIQMLHSVNISAPEQRVKEYPHQFSGGMRQRVMIAMALACKPELLIADEPTTALDVTIQAQILALISRLQKEMGMGVLLITHDLGVVSQVCDRVAVMYAGRIIEEAPTKDIFLDPKHPYTQGLLLSLPVLGGKNKVLATIPGQVPSLRERRKGCPFVNRCQYAMPRCHRDDPSLTEVGPNHKTACWLYNDR